jgi:CheY-like chemotaxis protein
MNSASVQLPPASYSEPSAKQLFRVASLQNRTSAQLVKSVAPVQVFQRAWKVLAENASSGLWMAEVLEHATDEIWLLDSTGVVFHANTAARELCPVGADWFRFQPNASSAWRELTTTDASKLETLIILTQVGRRRVSLLKCRFNERDHVLVVGRRDKSSSSAVGSEAVADNWIVGAVMPGFVHELSDSMTSVMAATAVLESQADKLPCQETIHLLLAAIRRSERVVSQMSLLATRRSLGLVAIATHAFLRSLKGALTSSLPKSIQIKFDLPRELPEMHAEPMTLLRALLTLCIWTSEPMEMEGVLRLRAEGFWMSLNSASSPRAAVQLTIEASSSFYALKPSHASVASEALIPAEVLDEIKSRLLEMGGSLEMDYGTPGKVVAKVVLPCPEAAPRIIPRGSATARGERLLVCDDDPITLGLLAMLLQKHGYVVDTAADGSEAIAAFTKSASPFDLVICDARMPQMDGISTLRAMQAIRRSVRFLLMSGSGVPADAIVSSSSGLVSFLPKPFEADVLLDRVAELLSRSAEEAAPCGAGTRENRPARMSFRVI